MTTTNESDLQWTEDALRDKIIADATASRLVAAAPDMLAALLLAQDVIIRLLPYEHDYEREADMAIAAAIAKATT